MQGKGVVRFFLVLLTIICIYQLFFIVPANRVEDDAVAFAESQTTGLEGIARDTVYNRARRAYLDSMSNEVVLSIPLLRTFTYAQVKEQQVALGLDLKGGMSVVMQVDLRSFLEQLSGDSKDPTFVEALDAADVELANAQSDYITLFVDEFRERAQGKTLASVFGRSEVLRDRVNFETTDGEVARLLRELATETVALTNSLLKQRIDKLGVTQPNISLDEARDLIVVELPGVENPARIRSFLQSTARLDFWNVYRVSDPGIFQGLAAANEALGASGVETEVEEEEAIRQDTTYVLDELGNETSEIDTIVSVFGDGNALADSGPLFDLMAPNNQGARSPAVIGQVERNNRPRLLELLNSEEVTRNLPADVRFRIGQKPAQDYATREYGSRYDVYALRANPGREEAALSGEHVVSAEQSTDPTTGEVVANLGMDDQGARTWAEITTKAAPERREFAIVLDDEVVSAPTVNSPITGGNSQISGGFTVQEAQDLAAKLQVGRLPAQTRIIQESIVGPTLGQENINSSLRALLIGFGLVMVFMVAYYAGAGLVSIVALLANIFFIFGALSSFGVVLTLPGIAGIVLTIGMAVDANVIIYERIREEMLAGKSQMVAVKDGFSNSYSAIIDANVTTLLTALMLFYFGLGPIKGFAAVLMIGIFTSVFTAVLVTRLIIDWYNDGERQLSFSTGWSAKVLSTVNIDWMSKRKIGYGISAVLVLGSLVSIFTRGFDLGVDFKGGYSYNIEFVDADVPRDVLETSLTEAFDGATPVVKAVDGQNQYNVTTSYQVDNPAEDADQIVEEALFRGVSAVQPGLAIADFRNAERTNSTRIVSSTKVGPTIADDIQASSYESAIFALALIFFYLFIRFSRWEYSAGAVIALFHDVIITLGAFSLFYGVLPFNMEIDQAFVAAILTVIGYSVNDTVVVYDRIREFIGTYTGRTKEEIFNLAINSTLSRTLITSGTTLLVVLMLFLFGGASIRGFAFALLVGILIGTYSSIFVASAVVNDLVKDIKVRKTKTVRTSTGSFTRTAPTETTPTEA